MPTISVRGFDCFYAEFGAASGPAVVLIHGWCSDSTDWVSQIAAFSPQYRVVSLDLRGHGRSDRTESGYETAELALDVVEALDRLGLADVHLVGHSLGGIIANLIAVQRPDLVRSVLLIDPAHGFTAEWAEIVRATIGDPTSADSETRAALAADLEPEVKNEVTDARRIRRQLQALALGPSVVWQTFAGMWCVHDAPGLREHAEKLIAKRKRPTLAIYAFEPNFRWEFGLVSSLRLDGRIELWPAVTHFLHQDEPSKFNAEALAWFAANAH